MENQHTEPQEKKDKKINPGLIIGIVIGVLIILSVGGYFINQYTTKRNAEAIVESLTGGKVSTKDGTTTITDGESSTVISDSAQKWPSGLPENAPEFKYGDVKASSSSVSEGYWSIILENVSDDANAKYETDLANAGWVKDAEFQYLVSVLQYKKSDYTLTATYDASSNSEIISISKSAE
jgi:hypothetical protein